MTSELSESIWCSSSICCEPLSRSSGKERDAGGEDFFGARYYGFRMGRFLTPDWANIPAPIPYSTPGEPQSLNLYSYALNNPVTGTDPDGHLTITYNSYRSTWTELTGYVGRDEPQCDKNKKKTSEAASSKKSNSISQSQMGSSGDNFQLANNNLNQGIYLVVDSVRITPEGVSIKFKLVGAPGKKEVVQFESLKERAAGGSKEYGEHATWDYPNGFSDGWSTGSGRPTNTSRQTYYFADPRDRDRLFPVMVKDKAGHFLYSLDVTFTDKGDIYVNRQHVTSPSWYAP